MRSIALLNGDIRPDTDITEIELIHPPPTLHYITLLLVSEAQLVQCLSVCITPSLCPYGW